MCRILRGRSFDAHRANVFDAHSDSKGPDQTAHLRSLIRAFAVRVQNHQILENTPKYLVNALIRIRGLCRLICIFTVCICPEDILTSNAAHLPASVAQLDVPPTGDQEVAGPHLVSNTLSWRFDHEIFSTVILPLPLIQEGQLSVSGERMCTILVNRLED